MFPPPQKITKIHSVILEAKHVDEETDEHDFPTIHLFCERKP